MWCEVICCGNARMYALIRMETEVCLRARFSHAVWSLPLEVSRRRTSPFVNRTGERVLCGYSAETRSAFPREWLNAEREERGERNTLSDLREPINGPDSPKKAGMAEEMSQQILQADDLTSKTEVSWCLKMIGVWGKGEDPRSGKIREKVGEWSGTFSFDFLLFFFTETVKFWHTLPSWSDLISPGFSLWQVHTQELGDKEELGRHHVISGRMIRQQTDV